MPYLETQGLRISYRQRGRQSRLPSLLCVHGAGAGSLHFSELLEGLAVGRRVVAVDLPGHGRSDPFDPWPADEELPAHYVSLCAAFAEQLGLGRFIWMGHSMGGALGLFFALRYPERLAALGSITSTARITITKTLLGKLDQKFELLPALFADTSYSPYTDRNKARGLAAQQLQCDKGVLLADFRACRHLDLRQRLGELRLPIAVISASDDIITPPPMQRELVAALPNATLTEIARGGHFVMRERPEPVLAALKELLARVG